MSCLARQAHLHFGDNLAKGMQSTENDNVFVSVEQLPVVRPVVLRAGRHGDRVGVSSVVLQSSEARRRFTQRDGSLGALPGPGQAARRGAGDPRGRVGDRPALGGRVEPHRGPRRLGAVLRGGRSVRGRARDLARPLRAADAIARRVARTDAHVPHESRVDADRGPRRLRGGPAESCETL